MNLLISSAKLADAARTAGRAVRRQQNNRFPILDCCRLSAGGASLTVHGTDLDTAIEASTTCDVIEPGEAVVDAGKLSEIAGKLQADVHLEVKSDGLVVKCGRSRFTLTMQSIEDYPPALAVDTDIAAVELGEGDVMALFDGAATAAGKRGDRIYLAGPTLFGEQGVSGPELAAVGTDAVCLSYAATQIPCPNPGAGVIIHRDTCKLAVSMFGETGALLRISNNLIELASDTVRLVAKRLGVGKYGP
jgi:DNA polymerase III subunit beta